MRKTPVASKPTLVLASSSRYRKALLERLNLPFLTCAPDVDESPLANETPDCMVERLTLAKARAVANRHPQGLVIASDQAAVHAGRILGKPGSFERAVAQLAAQSGNSVEFLTGIALFNAATSQARYECVRYKVWFRRLSEAQINYYQLAEPAFDCAGSFKSEGLGVALFERMEGDDPTALIGLPLIALVRLLAAEGIDALAPDHSGLRDAISDLGSSE